MTTKPQIISEYESAVKYEANKIEERCSSLESTGFMTGANWGSLESPIVKLMESALKMSECTCKVKPYKHQYMYPCERCEAITALDSLRKWVGNG